jgi:galactofuranosylgalactofuranosylrhamnosyl-N-acetylglucosaminyl-diphospho-decaprenol beta-1,5/1,6-galactofuranosyltransferase
MLDLNRPLDLHQAGALFLPRRLGTAGRDRPRSLASPDALGMFLDLRPAHYNAWWFFAFPLGLIDRVGLPLPLFIRGDDTEFGCRLLKHGIPTITVPGLSVWHEPFYLKQGGWHPYYDLRNLLIVTALHAPQPVWRVAAIFLRRLLHCLLRLNYFQASILVDALKDFCRGPQVLETPPQRNHQHLLTVARAWGPQVVDREAVAGAAVAAPAPTSLLGKVVRLVRCGLEQMRSTPPKNVSSVRRVIADADAGWWSLGAADAIGVIDSNTGKVAICRRQREVFTRLLGEGLRSILRFWWSHRRLNREWRAAFPWLASEEFWRRYLGLSPQMGAGEQKVANRPAA